MAKQFKVGDLIVIAQDIYYQGHELGGLKGEIINTDNYIWVKVKVKPLLVMEIPLLRYEIDDKYDDDPFEWSMITPVKAETD